MKIEIEVDLLKKIALTLGKVAVFMGQGFHEDAWKIYKDVKSLVNELDKYV